jgi:hypothetical protein
VLSFTKSLDVVVSDLVIAYQLDINPIYIFNDNIKMWKNIYVCMILTNVKTRNNSWNTLSW